MTCGNDAVHLFGPQIGGVGESAFSIRLLSDWLTPFCSPKFGMAGHRRDSLRIVRGDG